MGQSKNSERNLPGRITERYGKPVRRPSVSAESRTEKLQHTNLNRQFHIISFSLTFLCNEDIYYSQNDFLELWMFPSVKFSWQKISIKYLQRLTIIDFLSLWQFTHRTMYLPARGSDVVKFIFLSIIHQHVSLKPVGRIINTHKTLIGSSERKTRCKNSS